MSARALKSVAKGLAMLEVLNAHNGLSAVQLARHLRIPRSTAFRLLSSAVDAGFVQKDVTRRYRLTRAARSLTLRNDRDTTFVPVLRRLHQALGWPISIASLHGEVVLLVATSDRFCPQIEVRSVAGCRIPLETTAAGLVIASQLDPKQVRAVKLSRVTRSRCITIRKSGYATTTTVDERSIAVPLKLKTGPAALAVRLPLKADVNKHELNRIVKVLVVAVGDVPN